jgi:hypothetical protein
MKKNLLSVFLLAGMYVTGFSQHNILSTNPLAQQILLGNYNPTTYLPTTVINHPDTIIPQLTTQFSSDSLKSYLEVLSTFENRNTASDTNSNVTGIGAARRWTYSKFEEISAQNENRLIVSYLQFEEDVCNVMQHRNIFAVLPGTGPEHDEAILVEAHIDSRCDDACDTLCPAHGMEDNGSGSALVIELARVLSQYSFNRSLVFMLTIGEEQGLYGGAAFSDYADSLGIKLRAVFNNDIVGGITCGNTASPPGCPGLNDIDSLNVRMYSFGNFNSPHKSLARFSKLEYQENLKSIVAVPTNIALMTAEDRSGRGGDHIPFRQNGYFAVRFTSANEHGDGAPITGYMDRQHTSDDLLGVDTDNDQIIDSFFVDFNYLKRNTMINANAIAMAALGPITPENLTLSGVPGGIVVNITDTNNFNHYRVGIRSSTNDFDTITTVFNKIDTIWATPLNLIPALNYRITVAAVDSNNIESLFSVERMQSFVDGIAETVKKSPVELLQNRPNPFDEATTVSVVVHEQFSYKKAEIRVTDLTGKLIKSLPIMLDGKVNEVNFFHGFNAAGMYNYSLVIDNEVIATKQMIFAY